MAPSPDLSSVNFRNQTAIVTGTTNGLGLSVSEELVKRNIGTLIMGVRNVDKGEQVKADLLSLCPANQKPIIHVVPLQLGDFNSVVAFAEKVRNITLTLDILLLNAGLGGYDFRTTESGHESIMQINVYSNALLALELLPLLKQTALAKGTPSRLTWVGSFVQMDHTLAKKPLSPDEPIIAQFDDPKRFNASRYQDSKLMSTMIVRQLAQRVDRSLVIFNEVSPGPVLTNFASSYPAYFRVGIAILGCIMSKTKSLAEGVNKYIHAVGVAGEETHGEYISDYVVAP
jgi:NAD(P)-dependent dehydrogenase (short-subunit alcohol dehydrogenase family)